MNQTPIRFEMIEKYVNQWEHYNTAYKLWDPKRRQMLDKLAEKVFAQRRKNMHCHKLITPLFPTPTSTLPLTPEQDEPCVLFDTRMAFYDALAKSVRNLPSTKDIEFIHIDATAVARGVAAKAEEWKVEYGRVLHTMSKALMDKMTELMQGFEDDINTNPVT